MFKVLGKKLIEYAIERAGLRSALQPSNTDPSAIPPDLDPESIDIIHRVSPYTMTSAVRVFALIQAVRQVVNAKIAGSIVECGVWQGGRFAVAHDFCFIQMMARRAGFHSQWREHLSLAGNGGETPTKITLGLGRGFSV